MGGKISKDEFDKLIARALELVPEEFRPYLESIEVVAEERPSKRLLRELGIKEDEALYGLYEGTSLLERGSFAPILPDKITIFSEPLLEDFGGDREALVGEIKLTVLHEIGHHFGLGEETLGECGYE